MIEEFRDEYSFLSNFHKGKVVFEGLEYDYRENAFQAAKTTDEEKRKSLQHVKPSIAKSFGSCVKLRSNWEKMKYRIMYQIVFDCFKRNEDLRKLLIDTGDQRIVEGNRWGDKYWGSCNGIGENKLGEILMRVRDYFNGRIAFEFIDAELEILNEHCKSGLPIVRTGLILDEKYLNKGESFAVQDRKGNRVRLTFEEIDAWFHDEDYIGCSGNCDICLTPIC